MIVSHAATFAIRMNLKLHIFIFNLISFACTLGLVTYDDSDASKSGDESDDDFDARRHSNHSDNDSESELKVCSSYFFLMFDKNAN